MQWPARIIAVVIMGGAIVVGCQKNIAPNGQSPSPAFAATSQPLSSQPATATAPAPSPRGDGAAVVGTVVGIRADGALLTDIPVWWLAAKRADQKPFEKKECPDESVPLKMRIGDRECRCHFACWGGAFGKDEWGCLWGEDDKLVIVCGPNHARQNAAKVAGVSVGAQVQLTKTRDDK
jgi:hypothetical protein